MQEAIKKAVSDHNPLFTHLRREFHRIPEPAFEEHKTAALGAKYLRGWGYQVQEGIGRTGVVGLLEGQGAPASGRTIALRADMDALPMEEKTGLPFSSEHRGMMHACGHDSHLASVLGAAYVLAQFQRQLRGSVKILLQPSEEKPTGAGPMIKDGALENPRPDAITALHNWPDLPSGQLALRSGPVTGSVDRFEITIRGRGGHGARPHEAVDPVLIASHSVTALQALVSRCNDPIKPLVITIGQIQGGTAFNVIPDQVTLIGTVRAADPALQRTVPQQMEQLLNGVSAAFGGGAVLDYQWGIPSVNNDPAFTQQTKAGLQRWFSPEQVIELPEVSLVGEDFSLFLEEIPGTFFFLGTGSAEQGVGLHHPEYAVPESVLPVAVEAFCAAVLTFFGQE